MDTSQQEYSELLANIRRLTIFILDSLEEGSRKKTLNDREKRLLNSTATRLLRIWKNTIKETNLHRLAMSRIME